MPDVSSIVPHIEALIFASDKPLSTAELTDLVNNAMGFLEDRVATEQTEAALQAITEKYASECYSFE
ncbi:MAG: hypothetical protein ACKOC7_02190, partial [Sphingomonadales bacterium]